MSTDLVPKNATGTLVIRGMDDLARLGNMLAQSGYFTDAKDAAQAGVKVLAGLEMGIGAFSAMAGIHIIKGKPSIGAGLMAAAVKRHPKYDYRVKAHTGSECVIDFFEGAEIIGTSSFSLEDAKQAGLVGNDNWKRNPKNMLFARALSNGVRWYCPDVFDVSTYTPEELGASVDDEGNIIDVHPAPAPAPEKPALRASVGDAGEPDAPEEPDGEFLPEPDEATAEILHAQGDVTPAQLKKLAIDMRKQGLEDREVARAFMSWLFERPITSSKELSKGEASRILGWDEDKWENALADYAVFAAGGPPEEDAA